MKSYTILFVVLAVIVLLAACTDKSLNPIFYTLETERSLSDDRGIEDEAFVHELVRVADIPEDRYFVAANKIFTRTLTGNWANIAPPVVGALCNTIEEYGGQLYAGFFAQDGTGLGLYRTDPDPISWDNSVFDAEVQGIQIGLIKAVGTNLYVVTADWNGSDYEYYLYESNNGTSYNGLDVQFDAVSPLDLPIIDIVQDGATDIWVIAGPNLYRDSGVRAVTIQNDTGPLQNDPVGSDSKPLGGLLYSPSLNQLYVSGSDGVLWMWDTTFPWTNVSVSDSPRFTRFVDLDPVAGISDDILVGTQGTGYYELTGGVLANYERHPDYNISALYRGAVTSFFLDAAESDLFACTYGAGLWRADWSGSEWIWVQE